MRIKSVILPEILLYICCFTLVKHTIAHCGSEFTPRRKFVPGEQGRNVSLTVNCRQEDAILTWSNGGLPYLQEVTIYSSCIDPTNTSVGAVTDVIYWSFFGTSSELDVTQVTVEAFPGKWCSYYGCYERQARARFYTFSTVSCAWTEPAGLDLVPSSTHLTPGIPSQQTSSGTHLAPGIPSQQISSSTHLTPTIPSQMTSSSSYLAYQQTSSALLTSTPSPSPTPAVVSYTSTSKEGVSDSPPVYVWVVPVVLMVLLIIITAAVLILTCYIAAYKHGNSHNKIYLLLWMPFGTPHSTA